MKLKVIDIHTNNDNKIKSIIDLCNMSHSAYMYDQLKTRRFKVHYYK